MAILSNYGLKQWGFRPVLQKITKKRPPDLVILAGFGTFSAGLDVHVLRVDFQLERNPHRYRAPGKSIMQMVFYSIPYRARPEIGVLDGVFETRFAGFLAKMSPLGG